MGGIRKKTSKRGTTFQASKIKKKAAETRKKNARHKRNDVTWKSKKTKDPGIPNNFPYKDRVLAELAEQKKATEEARIARRQAQLDANAAARDAAGDISDEENPGILALHNRKPVNPPVATIPVRAPSVDSDVPPLIDAELPTIQAALDRADAVLLVLDARDPQPFRSKYLEDLVLETQGKHKLLLVLNKAELIPRESAEAWLAHLRGAIPEALRGAVQVCLFKSSVAGSEGLEQGMLSKSVPWGRTGVMDILEGWAAEAIAKGTATSADGFTATVMGLPNVGKSALINTLLSRPFLPTATMPTTSQKGTTTTTLTPIEVTLTGSEANGKTNSAKPTIHVIDTPGFEFNDVPLDVDGDAAMESDEEGSDGEPAIGMEQWDALEAAVAKDILTRNMGRVDKIKDPLPLVHHIIKRANPQDLMLYFNTPAFQEGDVESFLVSLARTQGRIKKHGVADTDAAAKTLLREWAFSTLPYYTMPAGGKNAATASSITPADEEVLKLQLSRKDMRKRGNGIIRLKAGEVDERELILDEEFQAEPESSDDDEEFDDFDDQEAELDEEEEDDEDDEDLDEDDMPFIDGDEEEVIFENDEEVESSDGDDEAEDDDESSSEEEAPPQPPPTKGKRKRSLATEDAPAPAPKKAKAKAVSFPPKGGIIRPQSPKPATPTTAPTSILKRKQRDESEDEAPVSGKAKKVKAAAAVSPARADKGKKAEKVAAPVAEPPVKSVKAAKADKKAAKAVEKPAAASKPAKANGKPVKPAATVSNSTAAKAKKAAKPAAAEATSDKPYDFGAHFF